MKIQIEKQSDHYRADCLDLPGSPPVGLGKTKEMAVAHLFYKLIVENTGGMKPKSWLQYLPGEKVIMVNNTYWTTPESYRN